MKFLKSSIVALTLTASTIALAHGPRAYFEQADTNKDGIVSKVEATQYSEARFADADTNKDGSISQTEVDAVKQKHQAEFEKKGQERFANKDANKDGKLQKSEVPRMPEAMFTRLDTNKDGALTAEEMRAFGPRHGKGTKRGAKAPDDNTTKGNAEGGPHKAGRGHGKHGGLFKMMDTNQDGNVTKAEAQAAADQHFARLDRNGDGNITAEERPQGRFHKGPQAPEGKQ